MDIVEEVKELILLEELDDAINVDESLVGAVLIFELKEDVEDHVFFVILKVVAFILFFLFTDS